MEGMVDCVDDDPYKPGEVATMRLEVGNDKMLREKGAYQMKLLQDRE